jgi:hypothetical protein
MALIDRTSPESGGDLELGTGHMANRHLRVQVRLDGRHPPPKVGKFLAKFFDGWHIGGRALNLTTTHRDVSEVILRQAECARDGRERGARALSVGSLLNLPQRGRRDSRSLCKLSLSDSPLSHSLVDHLRDGSPVAHITLLTTD